MSAAVGVIGIGNWGTALANYLAIRGHKVVGWTREKSWVSSINETHHHPTFLKDVKLCPDFRATSDLPEVLCAPVILLCVPAAALASIAPPLKGRASSLVVSAIKGFEDKTNLTPTQFLKLESSIVRNVVFSGPSFAKDIVRGRPAGIVAASNSESDAKIVAELFSGGTMKVYLSDDPLGVEIGGAVKNVIALAAGVCDGLSLGDSARAGLITRGLAEMMRLAQAMGGKRETLSGLSGLGDLIMTATCDASRNRTAGLLLSKGTSLSEVLQTIGSAVEGVHTTPIVAALAARHNIDMPITLEMNRLLKGEISPEDAVIRLLSRPIRREES